MMILRDIKSKMILTMLLIVLSAQGVWAQKVNPKLLINLSDDFKSVPVGQANFTKPDVSLKTYEADGITVKEDVTSYYTITYYILNDGETEPSYTRDVNNRDISTDNTTGTTVSKNYGTVIVGHKGDGTVTVNVKATPKAAFTEQYEEQTGSYEFTVTSVSPTVVLPEELTIHAFSKTTATTNHKDPDHPTDDDLLYNYIAKSEVLALPAKNLYVTSSTGFKQDLSSLYNVSYSFTRPEGSSATMIAEDGNGNMKISMDEYADNNAKVDILSEIEKLYPQAGDIKLTVTYTVADKARYGGYKDAVDEVTIHVVKNDFQTLTASLNFAEDHSTKETAIVFSRWNDKDKTGYNANAMHPLPVPTVTNSAGADISDKVRVKYDIVSEESEKDDCQRNHMNPWGEVWEAGESTQGSLNPGYYNHIGTNNTNPFYQNYKPGYVKIRAYAVTNLIDDACNEFEHLDGEGYSLGENEYRISEPVDFYIYIKKRKPTIVLSPNPKNITLNTNNAIDMNNRFDIKGYVTDEYDGTAGTVSYGAQYGEGDDTFWYTFEFTKDSGIEVVDWPHTDRVEMYLADGTKIVPSMEWGFIKKETDEETGLPYDVYGTKEVFREANDWNKTHDKSEIERFVYWSVKGFGTDNVWKMKFTQATDACQIKYRIYPFNHARWDVSDEFTVTYKILDAVTPTLNIDPDHLSALVNQADFVEPEVWVTNPEGKEITSDFKFKYTITEAGGTGTTVASPTGDNYTEKGKPGHEIAIGSTAGDVTVQVQAVTEDAQYSPMELTGTYTIHVFENTSGAPLYEIINSKDVETFTNDYAAAADSRMGKMHFINTGNLYTGYSIDGIPGLIMRFGKYDGSVWNIIADTSGDPTEQCNSKDATTKCIAYDETPVVLNEDGIATSGAFLEFTSATNGYLRVDARWEVGQSYTLIDFDYPDVVQTYTPTATTKGEYTFPYPLLADHSYQLYCSTEGQLNFHGIGFDPVFIKTREGGKVTKGSSFLNGYQNVPSLALDNTTNVTYIIDEATNLNNTSAKCAEIENAAIHKITAKNFTILDKAATTMPDATTSTDVVIQGKVMSSLNAEVYAADKTHTHGIPFKLPYYQLSIADIPTYRLGDGLDKSGLKKDASDYKPAPGTEVTTYNIPTAITMTYGGWKNKYTANSKEQEDTYEVKTDNEVAGYSKTDNQFSRHIDGFSWSNVGKTNPVSENNVGNYRAYRWTNDMAESENKDADEFYHNTFDLPAKGAYWKFEPEEDGVIFVYLVQNGVCQYTGNSSDLVNTTKTPHGLDWKPLYVVDESGKPADMLDATSMATIDDFVASGGTGAGGTDDESDAYTEGLVRASIADANIMRFRSMIDSSSKESDYNTEFAALRAKLTEAATEYEAGNKDEAKLDSCMYQWTYNNSKGVETGFAIDYKDADKLEEMKLQVLNHWAKPGERQVIFQDVNGPGYAMVSKAYVRYAINAKAGKTYWVFQQGSKPNLCGFGFVPYWFPNKSKVKNQEIILSDDKTLAKSLEDKDITKTSDVTYTRTFKNNTWASLCLPFSVSQRTFKKVFGDNAQIVTYDGATENGTNAHFIQHNYRMMEAGRGYFIKPAWTDIDENGQKNGITFENVTIETKVDDKNVFTATDLTKMPALDKFTMFDHEYYKANKAQALRMVGTFDGEDMPAYSYFINGKLYRTTAVLHCGPYRAYLKNPNVEPATAKMFANFSGTSFEEPYEDVENQESTVTKINGVHDFKGTDMTDLKLADGIYNVAGQKVADKNASTSNLNKGIYIVNGKKMVIK